jgi:PIN domain nuclease of toxin-antitoxin system
LTSYLLDTHIWAWSLLNNFLPDRLSNALRSAETVSLSSISFYEIRQKVRIGKWPEMQPHAGRLLQIIDNQGAAMIAVTPEIGDLAGSLEWDHRDPFDRMIAATSIFHKLPLISADATFDALSARPDWPGRIW